MTKDIYTPYHMKQALNHIDYAEDVRKRGGYALTPSDLFKLADVHAKLAIADAIERNTKAITANNQKVEPF